MVTNSENETVRLLFAILQQKNLKDVSRWPCVLIV